MTGPTARAAPIAHVLCMDIVEYAPASHSAQGRLLARLNADIRDSATAD